MSRAALLLSLGATVAWGFWAFALRLAGDKNYYLTVLSSTIGGGLLMLIAFLLQPNYSFDWKAVAWGFCAGLLGTSGMFLFLGAMSSGKTSVVVTLTALYPVVTILLSHTILGERLATHQWVGVVLAMVSLALVASEGG